MIRDDLDTLVRRLIDQGILFEDAQREFERIFIARALAKTNYNVCKAAKITGLHRNTLSRKMVTYRIKRAGSVAQQPRRPRNRRPPLDARRRVP